MSTNLLLLLSCLFCFCHLAFSGGKYKLQDPVPFYVNKIGPYSNPSETYPYYSLPFCRPAEKKIQHRHYDIGEALDGDTFSASLYDLRFGVPVPWRELCTVHLNKAEIKNLKKAIEKFYYFEMLYDDLPIYGFIGTVDFSSGTPRYFLFKHLHFSIMYNGQRVIHVNVTGDLRQVQELSNQEELLVEFSYSVRWLVTNFPYSKRLELYKDSFFSTELEIHWLSIMNSVVLALLLTGFIAIIILRVLRSDYTRYDRALEEEDGDMEDYGWKLIHGDVFRFPQEKMLFSSLVGNGAQFLLLSFSILVLALTGFLEPAKDNSLRVAPIILYALTAGVAGYVSSSFYKQMGGEHWAWNIVLTSTLFTVPFFFMAGTVNSVASYYDTTTEISPLTVLIVLAGWIFIGLPLTIIGGITGKRLGSSEFDAPTRTKHIAREIPPIPWYRHSLIQIPTAGFLPFSAIYIELYYIYSSVWGRSSYNLWGILFIVFIILMIVTASITIALTYFQLSMEDHRWWWRSFLSGGSTGLFIFAYSLFYYAYRSRMYGVLQGSFYFGYMTLICYFFFIMLGTVGWFSSLVFIRHIYKNLKTD